MPGGTEEPPRTGRVRKLTPKMEQFMELAKKSKVQTRRKELIDKTSKVEQLLSQVEVSNEEVANKFQDIVQDQTKLFESMTEETKELATEELQAYHEYFEEEDTAIAASSEAIKSHLDQAAVRPEDSVSATGSKTSRTSTQSQSNSIIEERTRQVELAAAKVKLLQEAEIARELQLLETQRRDVEQRAKLQAIERELELSKAKLSILSNVGTDHDSILGKSSKRNKPASTVEEPITKKPKTTKIKSSSLVAGYVPPTFESTRRGRRLHEQDSSVYKEEEPLKIEDAFQKLAEAIDRSSRHTTQIEPQIFTGDVLTYHLWKRNFEELIEKEVKPERRFIYLLKYTGGTARDCIDNLTHLSNTEAYKEGIKLLDERYGNKFHSYEAMVDKLEAWPAIKDGDGEGLRRFADFLSTCLSAMHANTSLQILNSMPENHKLLRKLPRRLVDRWSDRVDKWQYNTTTEDSHEYPPFSHFVDFIKRQARIELGPVKRAMNKQDSYRTKNIRVHMTDVEEGEEVTCYATSTTTANCLCCQGQHELPQCNKFKELTVKERQQFSYTHQLCRGCLLPGHFAWSCKDVQRCNKCQGRHHVLFHDDDFKPRTRQVHVKHTDVVEPQEEVEQKVVLATHVQEDNITAHIVKAHVYLKSPRSQAITVYAVVDNQSNACFVSRSMASKLNVKGKRTNVELHTMSGVEEVELDKVEGLVIENQDRTVKIELPPTFIKDGMHTSYEQIPTPKDVARWNHLQKIANEFKEVDENIEVGMLIGRNSYRATKLTNFIPSQGAEPYAVQTELGWGIVGSLKSANPEQPSTLWVHSTSLVEPSPSKLYDSYAVDFQDQHAEQKYSQDDYKFMNIMKEGMKFTEDGHVMLPLPIKDRSPLPNNASQAKGALRSLKKKFEKNDVYKQKYIAKMTDLLDKGYAEPAPTEYKPGTVWYWIHHGVFHPKKIEELRVVFNGKRAFLGIVLNTLLLQGPDQINSLIGILCRFRKELVTLTCDIEAMFYQVMVAPEDRDYLRFFWWPDGNTESDPVEYRMAVHLFGATSSPGVAHYALVAVAEMFLEKYGPEPVRFIKDSFYVDDGVTAVPETSSAVSLMKSSTGLCAEGGFNLTKFSSNTKAVIEQIPEKYRAKNLRELDLTQDMLPQGYTLGIFICHEEDHIRFQIQIKSIPKTRRGVLSAVSQVYDPLGLISPYILEGKRILQAICKEGLDWDEPITAELLEKWENWINQVKELESIKFNRCYGTKGISATNKIELHHFSDASVKGYGQCSYLRMDYGDGLIETALVMSKAKVTPKQVVTIPRLELAAAVLSVRAARFLQEQLKIEDLTHHFWTDSQVVLGYINNDAKKFHVYVANRVANIRDFSETNQWHYVETSQNPADIASRGATVQELKTNPLWRLGPELLTRQVDEWTPNIGNLNTEDPEIKKVTVLSTDLQEETVNWEEKFGKFSTWKSLTRGLAKLTQKKENKKNCEEVHAVTLEERKESEIFVLRKVQERYLKKELKALHVARERNEVDDTGILATGRLRKLDPFLGEGNLIRVGGRFKTGPWSYELKHPIIIPTESHVTVLLIRYIHAQIAHCGREATMSALRASGYWILMARRQIDSIIWKCVVCKRFRGKTATQKMGEVPDDRLEEVPPFSHVGVDFFGPYQIKQNRSTVKRWIVIYTCLVSRATHLDKAYGLSSDEFLNTYRRFLARRGAIQTLRCDRGTNFIGAKDELERNLNDVFDEKTKEYLKDSRCEFVQVKLNPPSASHMGGVWERPIGTGKRILNILLKEHAHILDDDLLDTVIAETEGIMNGMPLIAIDTSDANSMKPLTPAMLLTMKPSVAPPPLHTFGKKDVYSKKRWIRAQFVVEEFWKRWRTELLPKWQVRNKWTKKERNMEVGDIVLLAEDDAPRMTWQMARVTEVFPGRDQLVRRVRIATAKTEYLRPVHKLIVLVERSNPVEGAD